MLTPNAVGEATHPMNSYWAPEMVDDISFPRSED